MGTSIEITRKLDFDAGHRLIGHESKCATLHGHRYTAEITCEAQGLDAIGRVIDFSKIKELVGGWIDKNWDHTMILHREDPLLLAHHLSTPSELKELFGPRSPFQMDANPTAENMVVFLFRVARDLLKPHGIRVNRVRLYETVNCFADYINAYGD